MSLRLAVRVIFWLLCFLAVPEDLFAGNLSAEVEGLRVEPASEPARPLRNRETTYTLRLRDSSGGPVNGAKVTLAGQRGLNPSQGAVRVRHALRLPRDVGGGPLPLP